MPPLRERNEDIPLLVDHFIRKHNDSFYTKVTGCSQDALAALCAYSWPGNIRDLENAVQSAMIVNALEQCKHSKTDTANYLGISRKTLFNRMKKYGLE